MELERVVSRKLFKEARRDFYAYDKEVVKRGSSYLKPLELPNKATKPLRGTKNLGEEIHVSINFMSLG